MCRWSKYNVYVYPLLVYTAVALYIIRFQNGFTTHDAPCFYVSDIRIVKYERMSADFSFAFSSVCLLAPVLYVYCVCHLLYSRKNCYLYYSMYIEDFIFATFQQHEKTNKSHLCA